MYSVQNVNVDVLFRAHSYNCGCIVQIMTSRRDQMKTYQSGSIAEAISSGGELKRQRGMHSFSFVWICVTTSSFYFIGGNKSCISGNQGLSIYLEHERRRPQEQQNFRLLT